MKYFGNLLWIDKLGILNNETIIRQKLSVGKYRVGTDLFGSISQNKAVWM